MKLSVQGKPRMREITVVGSEQGWDGLERYDCTDGPPCPKCGQTRRVTLYGRAACRRCGLERTA